KSFAFFKCLDFPDLRFLSCAHCSASLAILERCDFNSYSCPCCGYAFCLFCKSEPHWPMDCEQFRRWCERWDAQCLFEENFLSEDHRVSFCLDCERVFTKEDRSPHDHCPYCWLGFDEEEGDDKHWNCYERTPAPKTLRVISALGITIKYCDECGKRFDPHTIQLRRLVNKDFSTLCWEARNERFNKSQDFVKAISKMFSIKKEQNRIDDLRRAVLFVVENCTAWLYLTKPVNCTHLKLEVSRLFRQLLAIQRSLPTTREIFMKQWAELEQALEEVSQIFRQRTESV
ncbi:hypothetical protein OESDEN_06696, partial [Oesophagostomum dentatum]